MRCASFSRFPEQRRAAITASAAPASCSSAAVQFCPASRCWPPCARPSSPSRGWRPATLSIQLIGGIIWGISAALHEATEIDLRAGRYTNTDLADYLVPVNADVGDVKVLTLLEHDRVVHPLGIKGLGELRSEEHKSERQSQMRL